MPIQRKLIFNPDPYEDVKELQKHVNKVSEEMPIYKINENTEYKHKPIKNDLYKIPEDTFNKRNENKYSNKISTLNKPDNFSKFYGSKKF
jgi:hypothetical protein